MMWPFEFVLIRFIYFFKFLQVILRIGYSWKYPRKNREKLTFPIVLEKNIYFVWCGNLFACEVFDKIYSQSLYDLIRV